MLIGLKLRLHGFGQIFERSNWLARIRPSLHGIRGAGGGKGWLKNYTYLHTSAIRAMQYWSKNQSGIDGTQLELFII